MERVTKQMVFGDDRSPSADVAWLWVNDHEWPGWQVDVVHVPDDHRHAMALPEAAALVPWEPEVERRAFAESDIVRVRSFTGHADPRAVLGGCRDADLVVIGSSGQGSLRRWLPLGSTAEWLLHQPPAPMVVAKSAWPVRRAVVGIDGSDAADRALQGLLSLPFATEIDVLAVGVYDGWTDPSAALELAAKRLAGAEVSHRTEQVRGRPTDTLLRVLTEHRADLVVLGHRGTSGLHRVLAGSTASAVTRAAACSVLLAP